GTNNDTYTVDNTSPTVILSDNESDNLVKDGDNVTITATFTETIGLGSNTPQITIGNDISATNMSGGPLVWTYSWTVGSGTANLDETVNVTIAVNDAAGNSNTAATGETSFTIDNTAPRVSDITLNTPSSTPTNSNTLIWDVEFSETVLNVSNADFEVSNTTATISVGTPAGNVYSVTVSGGDLASLDNTVTLSIVGGQDITDVGGNALTNTAPSGLNNINYTVDNTAPTVVLTDNESDNIVKDADAVIITATFTDVNGLGSNTPQIVIGNDITSTNMSGGPLVWTYSWTVGSGTANLDETANVTITVNDAAGNANTAATGETIFTIDNTAPRVSDITLNTPSSTPTNANTLIWNVEFSETVLNVSNADFEVSNTSATISVAAPAGNVYPVTVSGGDLAVLDNTVTLNFVGGQDITDVGLNAMINTAPTGTNNDTYTVDNTSPTVILSDNESDNLVKDGDNVTITATFTETIGLGSNTPQITIGNDISATNMSGGPLVWTYSWTVGSGTANLDETVNVTIAVNDAAGNSNTAATGETSFTIDNTAPRVSDITLNTPSSTPTNSNTLIWDVEFSETVLNVSNADFEVSNTTATISVGTPAGNVYSVTVSGGDLAGLDNTVTLSFVGGQDITDVGLNAMINTAPTGTNNDTYIVDNTSPTVDLSDDEANNIVKDGDVILVTATFTDAVGLGSNVPQIQIGSDISTAVNMSGSGLLWTYSWTVGSGTSNLNETATVSITVNDEAGNANVTATGEISFVVDNITPTVIGANIAITGSSSGNDGYYIIGDIVTAEWDNTGSGDNNTDIDVIGSDPGGVVFNFIEFGGGNVVASVASPDLWRANYTIVDNTENIESANSQSVFVTVTDDAGNVVSAIEGEDNVSVDNVAPLIANLDPADDASTVAVSTNFTLVFSENINSSFGSILLTSIQNQAGDLQSFAASNNAIVVVSNTTVIIDPENALTGNRDYYFNIAPTAFEDDQGNPFAGFNDVTSYNFNTDADNDPPILSITLQAPTTGSTSITADNSLTYDLSFDEDIVGISAAEDVTLNDVSNAFSTESFSVIQTSASTFELVVSGLVGNGDFSFTVSNGSGNIRDALGNAFVSLQSSTITIDQINPVLIYVDISTNSTAATVIGTVDEDLDVTVSINSIDYVANQGAHSGSGPFTWSITTNSLTDGDYNVLVRSSDAADNQGSTSGILTIDTEAPAIVSSTQYDSNLNGNIDQITIRFDEAVLDATVEVADFIITGETAFTLVATGTVINATDPGTSDDAFITFSVDEIVGTGTVDIDFVGSITDAVGNVVATETEIDENDAARPFVLKSHQYDLDNDGGIDAIVIEFSEPVSFSTAESADFIVTGATAVTVNAHITDSTENILDAQALDKYLTLAVDDADRTFTGIAGTSTVDVVYLGTGGSSSEVEDLQGLLTFDATSAQITAVDLADPVVFSVTSTDGTYIEGHSLKISLNVSENVTVSGTPRLQLETGAIDQIVDFVSNVADNSILEFDYTIQLDDESDDLEYLSIAALSLNGGSLKDQSGNLNNLIISLPSIGGGNSLGDNNDIIIDAVKPTFINAYQFDHDGNGDIDEIVLEMSESVSNVTFETFDFTLGNGTVDAILNELDAVSNAARNSLDVGDQDIYITLSVSVTGTDDISVSYNSAGAGGSLLVEDLVGNTANSNPTINTTDIANPVILNAFFYDTDENGNIDEIAIEFSENVAISNFELKDFTLGNSIFGTTSTVNAIFDAANALNASDIDDNDFIVTLAVSSKSTAVFDVSYEPNAGGVKKIQDDAGNETIETRTINQIDNAHPVMNFSRQFDLFPDRNTDNFYNNGDGDGDIDEIIVEFSEFVDLNAANVELLDFSFGGVVASAILDAASSSALNNGADIDVSDSDNYITFDVDISGTSAIAVTYDGSLGDNAVFIRDAAGNGAVVGGTSDIDLAPPYFLSSTFYDHNGDGEIEEILLELSESVDNASFEVRDFSLGASFEESTNSVDGVLNENGAALIPATNSIDATDADQYVTLVVNIAGTEPVQMIYVYDNNSTRVQDAAGNGAWDNSSISTIDNATPRITEAKQYDIDLDGSIDQILLTFTEPMSENLGWFSSFEINDFTLGNSFTGASNNVLSVINSATASGQNATDLGDNDQFITISVAVDGSEGISVLYNQTGVSNIQDASGNELIDSYNIGSGATFGIIVDNAAPQFYNAYFFDHDAIGTAGSGNIDEIVIEMSEPVSVANVISLEFLIDSGTAIVSDVLNEVGAASNPSINTVDQSSTDQYFTLAVNVTGTDPVDVDYTGNSLKDISQNIVENTESFNDIDLAAPVILQTFQYDTDLNGHIDEIVLEFTESMTNASFHESDFILGVGLDGIASTSLAVLDHNTGTTPAINTLDATSNDAYITLSVSVNGTAAVSIDYDVAGEGTLEVEDLASTPNQAINQSSSNNSDEALPVFFDASQFDTNSDGNIDHIVFQMSESLDYTKFKAANFDLGTGLNEVESIANQSIAANGDNDDLNDADNYVTMEVDVTGTADVSVAYRVSTGAEVQDLVGNRASNNLNITTIDEAPPLALFARQFDTEIPIGSGNIDQIIVEFSENLDLTIFPTEIVDFVLGAGLVRSVDNTTSDEFVILTVEVSGTDDITVAYNGIAGSVQLSDGTNNASENESISAIDLASPVFVNAFQYDETADGNIDEIVFEMSENVDYNTFESADFILGTGLNGVPSSVTGSVGATARNDDNGDANDNFVTVEVIVNGTQDVTIAYNPNGAGLSRVQDLATTPNQTITNASILTTDAAPPLALFARQYDTETPIGNGNIDQIIVEFSENLDLATYPTETVDFVLGAGLVSSVDNTTSDEFVILTVEVLGTDDITVAYNGIAGSVQLSDGTNNASENESISAIDLASPVFVNAFQYDETADGNIDEIVFEMSENVDYNTFESADFILGTGLNGVSSSVTGSVAATSRNNDTGNANDKFVTMAVSVNGSDDVVVAYNPNGAGLSRVQDLATTPNQTITNATILTTDVAKPVFYNARQYDQAPLDGDIDVIVIEMSEGISSSSFETGDFTVGIGFDGTASTVLSINNFTSLNDDNSDTDQFVSFAVSINGTDDVSVNYNSSGASGVSTQDFSSNEAIDGSINPVDEAIPLVVGVGSSTGDGSYMNADVIAIEPVFTENVIVNTVGGVPTIRLETGPIDRTVSYTSGSSSEILTFNYTVEVDDNSTDLDYLAIGSLSLNGSLIEDNSGNNALLTLSNPGTANSLAANRAIIVDGILPIIQTAWQYDTDGDGNIDEIVIDLSEEVDETTAQTADFSLSSGTVDAVSSLVSGNIANGLDISDSDEYLTLEVSVTGTAAVTVAYSKGTLTDIAGNLANSIPSITVNDQAVPVISNVTSTTPDGAYNEGDIIPIIFTLSESVKVSGTPQITLTTGDTDQIVNYSSGTGTSTLSFNYTVVGPTAPSISDGDNILDLAYQDGTLTAGISIQDQSANTNDLTLASLPVSGGSGSLSNNKNLEIDTTIPALESIGSMSIKTTIGTDGIAKGNDPNDNGSDLADIVVITMDFNDNLLSSPTVIVRSGGFFINNTVALQELNGTNEVWTATFTVNRLDADGAITFTVAYTDKAGNQGITLEASDTDGTSIIIDNTNPTVSYTVVNDPTLSDPYILTAKFSEEMVGLTIDDFTVTTSNALLNNLQNTSGNTWTLDVNPSDTQTAVVTVQLNDDGATDVAGNTISATTLTTLFDDQPPVLTTSNSIFGQALTLTVNQSEVGEIYYAIFNDGETVDIDNEAIKAQATGTLTTARLAGVANGLTDAVANLNYVVSETLPELRVNYDLKIVTEDKVNPTFNLSQPTEIDITSGGIVITAPELTDICLEGDYFNLNDIVLTETISTDFVSSNSLGRTLNLALPDNFEFNTSVGTVSDNAGDVNVDNYTISYIGTSTLVITYDVPTTSLLDIVTISGLEIRALGNNTVNNVQVVRSGGTGTIYRANLGQSVDLNENFATIFATLSTVAPFDAMQVDIPSTTNPYINENDSGILGDESGDGVTVYNADAANLLTSTPFTVNLINVGDSVKVYTDANLTSLQTTYSATLASDTYSPSVEELLGADAATVDMGVNTFWITTQRGTTVNSCESAATLYSVAIIRTENSANTTAFSLKNNIGTRLTFSFPTSGHTGTIFSGNGLSGKKNTAAFKEAGENGSSIQFIPSAAANEVTTEIVTYTLTNSTGIEANYAIRFYLTESDIVLASTNSSGAYQTRTYCQDEDVVELLMTTPQGINVEGADTPDPDFLTIRVYDYSSGARGVSLTNTVFTNAPDTISGATNTAGWIFDPASLNGTAPLIGNRYRYDLEFVYVIQDDLTDQETELAIEIVQIYRLPTVEITNFRNTLVLSDSAYYSNDDDAFEISVNVTYNDSSAVVTDEFNIDSYDIYKYDGEEYVLEATVLDATFNPADPNNDGTSYPESEELGLYRIIYTTATEGDALSPQTFAPPACNSTDTVDFEILAIPNYPGIMTDNTSTDIIAGVTDGDSGNGYLLEYCEGSIIEFLSVDLSSFGTTNVLVRWYSDSLRNNEISNNVSGDNNEVINIANQFFGGNTEPTGRQSARFYYSITNNTNLKTGVNGANSTSTKMGSESETNKVFVQVYPDPSLPVVVGLNNATNEYQYTDNSRNSFNSAELRDEYYFEYCVADGEIVTLNNVLIDASLDQNQPTESYFILYNVNLAAVDSFQTINANTEYAIANLDITKLLDYSPADSTSVVFYLSQRDHDNNYPDEANQYVGCESSLRKFNIAINVIPEIPDAGRFSGGYNNIGVVEYYLCSGDALSDISAPTTQISGNQSYTWYRQVGLGVGDSITTTAFNNRSISMNDLLKSEDFVDLDTMNSTNATLTYSYYVTQTFRTNVQTGFRGCESDYTQVNVNVIPDPTAPLVQDTLRYEESFCSGTTAGVSYTVKVNEGAELNIYSASETQFEGKTSRGTLIETLTDADENGLITITSDNLGIGTLSETVVYFKLSQQTNIEVDGSQFDGCETEIQDMSRIKLYVYNLPADPLLADETLYYCDTDKDDIAAVIATNVEEGGFVQWYDRNDNLLFLDNNEDSLTTSTILAGLLTLDGSHKSDSTYLFKYLQRTDVGAGVSAFEGCSSVGVGTRALSDTLKFTISVVRTPNISEVLLDVDGSRCEYEFNNSSTFVEFSGIKDWLGASSDKNNQSSINYFSFWKVANPIDPLTDAFTNGREIIRANPKEEGTFTIDINSLIKGDGKDDNNISEDSVLNVYITQTVGQLTSQNFAGCTSEIKLDTMNLYPEPAAPEFLLTTDLLKSTELNVDNGSRVINASGSDQDLSWSNYTYTFCDQSDASADVFTIALPNDDERYVWYDNRNAGEAKIDASLRRSTLSFTEASGSELLTRLEIEENNSYVNAGRQSFFVTTIRKGCETQQLNRNEIEAVIGEIPDPVFRWSGLTASLNNTLLEIKDDNLKSRNFEDSVTSVRVIINGLDSPLEVDESYVFTKEVLSFTDIDSLILTEAFPTQNFIAGDYEVSISMTSSPTCTQFSYDVLDSTRLMTLLPTFSLSTVDGDLVNNRYDEDFEAIDSGWLIDQRDYNTNGYQDRSINTGSSWINQNGRIETSNGPDGNYNNNEQSWIYSPNFNTADLNNPIVGLDMNYAFGDTRDGVVLQFSKDDGATWEKTGSYSNVNEVNGSVDFNGTTGVNWYFSTNIEAEPGQYGALSSNRGVYKNEEDGTIIGFNKGANGWSRDIPDLSDITLDITGLNDALTQFKTLFEGLNSIESNENIRFRFALGSNAAGTSKGFVFDNFKVFDGEKVPLIETFNSSESAIAKGAFVVANDLLPTGNGFVWINYFTDLASSGANDELNEVNQADPSARVGYYGIGNVPSSAIDGVVFDPLPGIATDPALEKLGWNEIIRDKALLADQAVTIFDERNVNGALQLTETGDEFTIDLQVSFETLSDDLREISLKVVVIEKEVSFPAISDPNNSSIVYSEGEIVKNVMREIIPSADGKVYKNNLIRGQVISENIVWAIENIADLSQMALVIFVQDDVTKKVLQAHEVLVSDIAVIQKQDPPTGFENLFGADDIYVVYPNPASAQFTIHLEKYAANSLSWSLYDQAGKTVRVGEIPQGSAGIVVSADLIPSGVYLLEIHDEENRWLPQRVIIQH
ncbi:MAG: arylamine N-acetyltransferase, partial [Cyclobacteriaceae bacterium]